jgi:uncharacterized surface anchored protein
MKSRLYRKKVWLSAVAAALIWTALLCLTVCAQTTGSIELQLPKDSQGVEMTLYAVASFDQGNYTYLEEFEAASLTIDDLNDDAQAKAAAEHLAVYADLQEIQGISMTADEDGIIRFAKLDPALYLVAQTDGLNRLEVQAALIPVPYAASNGQEWIYDAVISPKYSVPGGAVIVSKVDDAGNAVGQARFVLQKKIYVDEVGEIPEEVETAGDDGGTYYWKEFQANLISSENGQIVIRDMPFGTYRFVETQSPDGYILTSVPGEFTIDSAGTVVEKDGVYEAASGEVASVTVVNQRTTLSVNKVDSSGTVVPGAKLVVKDSDGNALLDEEGNAKYCFTTTDQPYELKTIPAGDYYLCELESPDGYQVAHDVPFSVSDEADAVNTVTMVDEREEATTVSLRVTKSLEDLTGRSIMSEGGVFYVALFEDEACASRVSDVLPLQYQASSSATATFRNLQPDTDYYVAETTEYGEVIQSTGAYAPFYPNGQLVRMTLQAPEGEFSFLNLISDITSWELPPGLYSYSGKLTITKRVLLGTDEYETDDIYYAALFTDAAHTEQYGKVIALEMNGSSAVSVTLDIAIGTNVGDSMTYYMTETDAAGTSLEHARDLEFTVDIDKTSVTLGPDHLEEEVTITNLFEEEADTELWSEEEPDTEETESEHIPESGNDTPETALPENPGGTVPSDNTPGSSTPGTSTVQTGDATPVGMYLILLVAAIAVLIGAAIYRKCRKK